LLNGVSYLAVVLSLLTIRVKHLHTGIPVVTPFHALREGLAFAYRHATIAPLLALAATSSALGINMVYTLLPALASTVLEMPQRGYAILSATIGVGSVAGSLLNVILGRRYGRGSLIVLLGLTLPFGSILLATMNELLSTATVAGLLGFGYTVFFVTANVLVQSQSDAFHGRVMSLWSLNRFALAPLSALAIGALADIVGTKAGIIICALIALGLSCYLAGRSPTLRRLP
jgi:MFS family permease